VVVEDIEVVAGKDVVAFIFDPVDCNEVVEAIESIVAELLDKLEVGLVVVAVVVVVVVLKLVDEEE
jgi:hypothetical protein